MLKNPYYTKYGMSKLTKILGIFFAFCVLAAAGAALAVKLLFPPAKIQAMVLERATAALQREVKLGAVSVSLFKGGLVLEDLEVSEAATFKQGVWIKAEEFQVKVKLAPLLHKKVEVDKVVLRGLDVKIVKTGPSTYNFSDLLNRGQTPISNNSPKASTGAAPALALLVSQVAVSGGKLHYIDKAGGIDVRVEGLETEIQDLALDKPFPASFKVAVKGKAAGTKLDERLEFKGVVDPVKQGAVIERLVARLQGHDIEASGEVFGAGPTTFRLTTTVGLKDLAPPSLGLERAKLVLDGGYSGDALTLKKAEIEAGENKLEVSGKVSHLSTTPLPKLKVAAFLKPPATEMRGVKLPPATLKLAADVDGDAVSFKGKLESGLLDSSVSGTVSGLRAKTQAVDVRLQAKDADLGKLAALHELGRGYGVTGTATLDARVRGTSAKPEVSGDLKLSGVGARYYGMALSGLVGSAAFTDSTLKLDAKGRLDGADLALDLDGAGLTSMRPSVNLSGSLAKLSLGALQKEYLKRNPAAASGGAASAGGAAQAPPYKGPVLKTKGSFQVARVEHPNFNGDALKMDWNMSGVDPTLKNLGGKAGVRIGPGKLEDLAQLAETVPALKVLLLPVITLQRAARAAKSKFLPGFDVIQYESIVGDYAFAKGVMTFNKSDMKSSAADVETRGKADLGNDALDLYMTVKVPRVPPVGMKVGGKLAAPEPKLDVKKLLDDPAVKKQTDQLLKQGEQLLKGLFR